MKTTDLLRALMAKSGDNPYSLAHKTSNRSKQPQIYKFLNGLAKEPRRSTLEPIAEYYEISVEAFYDEALAEVLLGRLARGEPLQPEKTASRVKFSLGADESPEFLKAAGMVPLISWVQAGAWSDVADPYALGDAEEWLPCPARHGSRTYCLRVRGESMFNPGGTPSYANGDIIFVDPDRDAQPGDRVVVRLDDQQEATFKQLVIEDGRKLLKALNPQWTPRYVDIDGHATITGVVIGKWVAE